MSTSKTVTVNGTHGKKIKAIVLSSTGGGNDYTNLKIKEEEYPKMERDDQVVVKIKAAGLNFAELMQRQGLYKPVMKTPYTPGFEASGVIEEVGSSITDLKVGDRVIVFNSNGIWKEVVALPRVNVLKMPDAMSFEEGAAFIVNYLTAYQILFKNVSLKAGDIVLIHMAAGGVGTAAIQLCKTVPGVTVIGTASSAKHDFIKEIGVNYAIDYTTSDYVAEVKKLFPNGVDVVLDPLNGDNSIKGYNLLKPFGRICHYGAASIANENRSFVNAFKAWWKCLTVNSFDIISENKTVSGYHLGYLLTNHTLAKEMLADLNTLFDFYAKGIIKIKIDSVFSYSKIGEAMKRMHSRQNIGKVILKPDGEISTVSTPDQIKIITTVVTTTTTATPAGVESVSEKTQTPEINGKHHVNGDLPKIATATATAAAAAESPAQPNGEAKHESVVESPKQNGHHKPEEEVNGANEQEAEPVKLANGHDNQTLPVHEPTNGEPITA